MQAQETGTGKGSDGLNVVGFFSASFGLGETARLLVEAIDAAGIEHVQIDYDQFSDNSEDDGTLRPLLEDPPYATNLLCLNGDTVPHFARKVGKAFFENRRNIGLFFWETEDFSHAHQNGLMYVDEVWVMSDFVRQAVQSITDKPVRYLPHPMKERSRSNSRLPDKWQFSGRPLFLFIFDGRSSYLRKNPIGTVNAFVKAFPEPRETGPVLFIKAMCTDAAPVERSIFLQQLPDRPDIIYVDEYLPREQLDALMRRCDCYVSLHRAEGLGLTLMETMIEGKPCIASEYSGNLQFMNDANSYLCPVRMVEVGKGNFHYDHNSQWADPDTDAAAELMRHVLAHPQEAIGKGAQARADLLENFSIAATASRVHELLADNPSPDSAKQKLPNYPYESSHMERAYELLARSRKGKTNGNWLVKKLNRQIEKSFDHVEKNHRMAISASLKTTKKLEYSLLSRIRFLEAENAQLHELIKLLGERLDAIERRQQSNDRQPGENLL